MQNIFFAFITTLIATSCGIPSDMAGSWDEARSTHLRVGLIDNPPYSDYSFPNQYSGSDVDILRGFAEVNDLDIEFYKGHESQLFEKLKKKELHVVAGGIPRKTIWKKHAGRTCPYDGKHVFTVPMGENKLLYQLDNYILTMHAK